MPPRCLGQSNHSADTQESAVLAREQEAEMLSSSIRSWYGSFRSPTQAMCFPRKSLPERFASERDNCSAVNGSGVKGEHH